MHARKWVALGGALLLWGCADEPDDGQPSATTNVGAGGSGGATSTDGGSGGEGGVDPCVIRGEALSAAVTAKQTELAQPGGVQFAVITDTCGLWEGAAGLASTSDEMTTEHRLRIGSITKTYVAATILQLVEEGAVSLDDTVDAFADGIPSGDAITVRMVLNHTGGIFNYTNDTNWMEQAVLNPMPVTPQEMVDLANSHGLDFSPGDDWNYSNTGYIVAGMVIAQASGLDAGAAIRDRALDVAGVAATYFDGEESVDGTLATGFSPMGSDFTNVLHPSVPWTAGTMVSTASDVARWAHALYGGDVLPQARLDEMLTGVEVAPNVAYGLGCSLYEPIVHDNIGPAVGHGGGIPGYLSDMIHFTNDGTTIVVLVNASSGSPETYVNALIDELYR